ncbi:MAG: CfrBI family restriction endonuclease [Sedimentisphaerales bacterium]|nr:CfrBI family restriction endonuclease [Sedimentisphaerales bacterium]
MIIDYKLKLYRNWMQENITLSDPFSPTALKRLTHNLLLGGNYRLLTEDNTKGQLVATFLWLSQLQKQAKKKHGSNWLQRLFEDIYSKKRIPPEMKLFVYWIMGLAQKTAKNLGLKKDDLPSFFNETVTYINQLLKQIKKERFKDEAWLMMMAGAATLSIRGSKKSEVGKKFEGVFLRSLLSILGFTENENFWMNVGRDLEVGREADAEVQSRRGRIRMDMALIASGNQEVIEDKIGRVGRNGIVIFDILGSKSQVYQTAQNNGVKLIQIRNCEPLLDTYRHLGNLVRFKLNKPPRTPEAIQQAVDALPISIFTTND